MRSGGVTAAKRALPSGVWKTAVREEARAAPLELVALPRESLDARVERHRARDLVADLLRGRGSAPPARSGRTRAATSPNTSHSGFALPMRRPATSGEKMMRRSVEVSVPPPGDS